MGRVSVVVDGVKISLSAKGTCRQCGEVIVYAPQGKLWLHAERVRGNKYYSHVARPERRVK